MSLVIATPEVLASTVAELAAVHSSVSAARAAAAASTVGLVPAAADQVSSAVAQAFSHHAKDFQAKADRAAAFHRQFVQNLSASAHSYAGAEAANAASMQPLSAGAGLGTVASRSPAAFSLLPVNLTVPEGLALLTLAILLLPVELPLLLLLLLLHGTFGVV
jgi:PE family